ncbi:MAG: class A beta-lactamase [Parabacteroides sp.]
MKRLLILCCMLCQAGIVLAQNELIEELKSLIRETRATVGVAIIMNGSELMTINNQYRFPMMGFSKFHQALAVLNHLDKHDLMLDTEIYVKKEELRPDTHSPLRDRYPLGDFNITVGDLLRYSISQNDNVASDILYKYIGGPKAVQKYMDKLGIKDVSISLTEAQVEAEEMNEYENWCTPSSAVLAIETFLQSNLFPQSYKLFLERALVDVSTGKNKMKALLPKEKMLVGHKTGESGRNEYGIKIADNDVGFCVLPDGSHYSLAVLMMNSHESDAENAALIARISKAVYDYCVGN